MSFSIEGLVISGLLDISEHPFVLVIVVGGGGQSSEQNRQILPAFMESSF